MQAIGLPVEGFRGFRRLKRLKAGKRQARMLKQEKAMCRHIGQACNGIRTCRLTSHETLGGCPREGFRVPRPSAFQRLKAGKRLCPYIALTREGIWCRQSLPGCKRWNADGLGTRCLRWKVLRVLRVLSV